MSFLSRFSFVETAIHMEAREGKEPSLFLSAINLFAHLTHETFVSMLDHDLLFLITAHVFTTLLLDNIFQPLEFKN